MSTDSLRMSPLTYQNLAQKYLEMIQNEGENEYHTNSSDSMHSIQLWTAMINENLEKMIRDAITSASPSSARSTVCTRAASVMQKISVEGTETIVSLKEMVADNRQHILDDVCNEILVEASMFNE